MATRSIGIYQTPEQCAADPIAVANGLEPGDFIYEDVNGDHVIDGNDKQVLLIRAQLYLWLQCRILL